MRIAKGPLGGRKRVLKSDAEKIKYYLVCEGRRTEPIYFEALKRCREKLGVLPRIELLLVERSYSEYRFTNPKTLLDTVRQYIVESSEGIVSYQEALDWILDSVMENEGISEPNPRTKGIKVFLINAVRRMGKRLNDTFPLADLETVCGQLSGVLSQQTRENWVDIVNEIPNRMELTFDAYNPSVDKVCLIVDRDRDSFTKEDYEKVRRTCSEQRFRFYPSNPCFEFWLLTHYDGVHELDKAQLLENPKVTPNCRYAEVALRGLMKDEGGYTKSKYDADKLMERVDHAVNNAGKFCQDEEQLEHTLGSRVGLLIQDLRGNLS